VQPQQPSHVKSGFYFLLLLCIIHQRGLVVPMRKFFGMQALATPGILALLLMLCWGGLSNDPIMLVWIAIWSVCFVHRYIQSRRMERSGARVHSQYDGWPYDAIKIGRTENIAKLVVEPLCAFAIGALLLPFSEKLHLNPTGLPLFFMLGGFTLMVIEAIKQSIWKKRTQAMMDAQLENEGAVREFREKFGS
jgi:hypothetical protein